MFIPFGFSVGDIIKAIELSRWIVRSLNGNEGSSRKYQQFKIDIEALGTSLNQLKDLVEATEKQYPRWEWQKYANRSDERENIWYQVTGDFYQTLKKCEELVACRGRSRNGRTRAFTNLSWRSSPESAIDNLSAKLRDHIAKVEFCATPSRFEALIRHGKDLQSLRRQVDCLEKKLIQGTGPPTTLWDNVISVELKAKLEDEFNTNRPSWLAEESELLLKESFEALVFNFTRSTVHFNPTPRFGNMPELPQFLSLAKSIWISERIKGSQRYKASSTESIWADRMRELEDHLRGQLHRFETGELAIPPVEEMLELPSDLYTISKGDETEPDPGVAGPPGEQLLQLELLSQSSNSESSLLVFRESDLDFLFVISMTEPDALGAPRRREVDVGMDRHRLVPIYASPTQTRPPRNSMLIFNERGTRSTEYAFHDLADVQTLQRALTGYRVHHAMSLFSWRLNGSQQTTHIGRGALQLWQYKPLPSSASRAPNADLSVESAKSPIPSGSSGTFVELMSAQFQDRRRSSGFSRTASDGNSANARLDRPLSNVSSVGVGSKSDSQRLSCATSDTILTSNSSVSSPVRGPRGSGTQALKPEPPVLVILTMCEERYSFLHLTCEPQQTDCMKTNIDEIAVDENIYVNPGACGCRNQKLLCDRVILESKNRNFTIRTLSADQKGDQGLSSWDLSVFRFPRSEKFRKAVRNDKVKTLELKFASADEKDLFLEELTSLVNCWTVDRNDFEKSLREKKKNGAKPSALNVD